MSYVGILKRFGVDFLGKGIVSLFGDEGYLRVSGPIISNRTVSNIATAGVVSYTPAQVLGGLIIRDPAGASRADTIPTAAAMLAAMKDVKVGDSFVFMITNAADAAETITLTTNTGVTLVGTMDFGQNASRKFAVVVTGVGANAAYSVFNLGNFTT